MRGRSCISTAFGFAMPNVSKVPIAPPFLYAHCHPLNAQRRQPYHSKIGGGNCSRNCDCNWIEWSTGRFRIWCGTQKVGGINRHLSLYHRKETWTHTRGFFMTRNLEEGWGKSLQEIKLSFWKISLNFCKCYSDFWTQGYSTSENQFRIRIYYQDDIHLKIAFNKCWSRSKIYISNKWNFL